MLVPSSSLAVELAGPRLAAHLLLKLFFVYISDGKEVMLRWQPSNFVKNTFLYIRAFAPEGTENIPNFRRGALC